jgi:CheY-like chemotaxis protein
MQPVLIVEDEIDSLEMVQELLEYHGIQTLAAYNAEDALELLKDTQPSLVIIDLALPGIDGWLLLQEIQKRVQGVPCVAVTAYHTAELAHKARKAGFDGYFAKPIQADSFWRDIKHKLEE